MLKSAKRASLIVNCAFDEEALALRAASAVWRLNAHVRKGEQGSLVIYADKITRTETDTDTG
jgi:antirestriction protein ArdC